MTLPKWFFPATRMTQELRRAGYRVDIDRDLLGNGIPWTPETYYFIHDNTGKVIGRYTTDLPFEGLRIGRVEDEKVAKIMSKYAKLPQAESSPATA